VVALDGVLGVPLDTYVNGSQVWISEDGPRRSLIEWRLHPVAGYHRPAGLATEEVFAAVALALGTSAVPPAPPSALWEGLEAYPISADEPVEPAELAAAGAATLGIDPDAAGLVDHEAVADAWEASRGQLAIVAALLDQLAG
jgi:hypothetical protein